MMDSRERVLAALSHREPDRVPIDYWAAPEVSAGLRSRYGFASQEELLDHFGVDFRYIEGPRYIGPEPRVHPDGAVEDHFGVPRVLVEVGSKEFKGTYREVIRPPLEQAGSLEEIQAYDQWPSPDWFDYACVRDQAARARRSGKAVVFVGDRMNRCAQLKPAMYLRGVTRILEDLALHPEIAEYLFSRITGFYLEYARRIAEAAGDGIDIFMTGDDFGAQNGLIMSPEMWRRFLRPGFQAMIDVAGRSGYRTAHHSCGSIKPIIPDMIDCGLDILNPLQPDVRDMDRAELKARFGDRLCFHGSISIQRTLPFGTPQEIREEVRERFETLGPKGGFIFCTAHNLQVDTPFENIEALFDAYRECRYGAG
jgi:uroporphyrinogen decarboxylase